MTGPQVERVKIKMEEIFQSCGLKITIEANLQIMDFLDVTFNFKNEKYYPLTKPSNDPLYINALSNHPENIIEEIPTMTGKSISGISCDEHEVERAKGKYSKDLENNGFNEKYKYHMKGSVNRARSRKVISFSPPYSRQGNKCRKDLYETYCKALSKTPQIS